MFCFFDILGFNLRRISFLLEMIVTLERLNVIRTTWQ